MLQCSSRIPHGLVESFCTRLCSYSCDYGYVKNANVRYLECSRLGYWESGSASTTFGSASDLCIRMYVLLIYERVRVEKAVGYSYVRKL